jgi:hypothetical protein
MANQQNQPQQQPQPQKRPLPQEQDEKRVNPVIDYSDEPPPTIQAGEAENEDRENENEGEGNRTADRNYRRGVQQHLKNKDVNKEAKEASEALDDENEREELEDAEEAGRKGRSIH